MKFAVDKISENTKGNISENILEKIEEKEKFMAEEEIKRIKIKSNLQRIKTNENKLVELLDKYSTGKLWNGYNKTLRITSYCLKFIAKVIDGLKSSIRKSQLKARCFSDAYLVPDVIENQHDHVVTAAHTNK